MSVTRRESTGPRPMPPTPAAPAAEAAKSAPAAAPAAGSTAAKAPAADTFQASATPAPFLPAAPPATAEQFLEIKKARSEAGLKGPAVSKISPELHSPTRTSLSLSDIRGLEKSAGGPLSVGDLAAAFPNAKIQGKGASLAEISRKSTGKVGADGMPVTLGAATVDRNGDLDVSSLYRQEISKNNQNLILRKGDEYPVPLSHTIKNSEFVIGDEAHKKALAGAGFATREGKTVVDMRDMGQVQKALQKLGVDPANPAQIGRELAQQGVQVPMSPEDQLRRVLVGKLDSGKNELDIDDKLVNRVGDHNQDIRPTVYASAKVSPEHLDDVILQYKRFNNQSFAGQGSWVTQLLGKDKASQHEGDSEATFIKIDRQSHEVQSLLAARHYYGELYSKKDIEGVKARTGRDDLTTSIAYKAHGSRLAEPTEKNVAAGHGEDGAKWYDPRDRVLKDNFMGMKDVQAGKAEFIPKEKVDLVVESEDKQSLNLDIRFGATRKGILGTGVMDIYNDGTTADRFNGTDWYYKQEKLNLEGNAVDRAARKTVDGVKSGYQTAKQAVSRFLDKLKFW